MSTRNRIWDKEAVLPSMITVFSMAFLAQIPHIYYLHEIVNLNNWSTLPLLIAFPIFGAIGLSAVALLISETLYSRVRNEKERNLFRYLIRGSLIAILIYFVVQILLIFFLFEVFDVMSANVINSVTFKEILGMSIVLIIGVFINPPIQMSLRRKK
ncbi:MAG: hypothetical protein ACFFDS_00425 [Candidatus Thorarchaeota archaeon]